jgi:hypothetical protein
MDNDNGHPLKYSQHKLFFFLILNTPFINEDNFQ